MAIFQRLNEFGEYVTVVTAPKTKHTAHGERAAMLQHKFEVRHVPKVGHHRKVLLSLGLRAEGRSNPRFDGEFVPDFMVVQPASNKRVAIPRPHGPTLIERYLLEKKRRSA